MDQKSLTKWDLLKTDKKNLVEKVDKISTALYLVSSLMSDKEPIKWQIRKNVVGAIGYSGEDKTEDLIKVLENTNHLLYLSARSNLISSMNLAIIEDFILNLVDALSNRENFKEHLQVREDLSEKGQNYIKDKKETNNVLYKPQKTLRTSGRKDKRREMVIGALKKRNDSSIKDITKEVKGCSEKTIQREINDLIEAGLVSKSGERRWSRYSLRAR
ncbi:MAG: hypothetical protein MRY49_02245 [Candidatus Pacebacteria bacterium]|nr:hypothetical protein [Candidatus Paceibacterota bacterium]